MPVLWGLLSICSFIASGKLFTSMIKEHNKNVKAHNKEKQRRKQRRINRAIDRDRKIDEIYSKVKGS